MIDTVICNFCNWKGTIDIDSDQCPHCNETGHLIPENEYQDDKDIGPANEMSNDKTVRFCPENMQAIYGVVTELKEDAKQPIK